MTALHPPSRHLRSTDNRMSIPLVLLADDDPLVLGAIEASLRAIGFDTATTSGGALAIEALELVKPDLVVLDIVMPEVGGLEVLRHIRSQPELKTTPVILLSARPRQDEVGASFESQPELFLLKNSSPEDLARRISNWFWSKSIAGVKIEAPRPRRQI